MRNFRLFLLGFLAVVLLASTSIAAESGGGNSPLRNATVSFGAWITNPPTDRHPNASPNTANHHEVVPFEVSIKAGGTVNFIISGLHQIIVYDDGTQPEAINIALTTPMTNLPPPAGVLINDPTNRIYRGPDPSVLTRDRVEVVHFDKPGVYLVICGVLNHFNDGMFGFVRVLPSGGKSESKPHHR